MRGNSSFACSGNSSHGMSTILGTLGLVAMAVISALLALIGMKTGTRADRGRYIGTALVAAPFVLAVMPISGLTAPRSTRTESQS